MRYNTHCADRWKNMKDESNEGSGCGHVVRMRLGIFSGPLQATDFFTGKLPIGGQRAGGEFGDFFLLFRNYLCFLDSPILR